MSEETSVQEVEEVKEFDFNSPELLEEEAEVIDPDRDADEIPPPPPDAIYVVNWDFAETDAEKQFVIRKWSKGFFLMTSLVGKIVDCSDARVSEREWTNRSLRSTITTITMDGASTLTDWLKSVGKKAAVVEASRIRNLKERFEFLKEAVTNAIVEGAQGKVATQWQASYKRVSPTTDQDEYLRPGGKLSDGEKIAKDHPIQKYRGMKNFPFREVMRDGETVKVRNPIATFIDPDTNEEVEARANAEVKTFIPAR
jgi:hypothetical protein